MKNTILQSLKATVLFLLVISCTSRTNIMHNTVVLRDNWHISQSDSTVTTAGSDYSKPDVNTSSWHKAFVPSTIMGVLTANGMYKNIFVADSISKVDKAQFDKPWWYRKEFVIPVPAEGQHVTLCFDGISYYANIWLNGQQIASRDQAFGTFRRFEYDITSLVKDTLNVLAVEVFRQQPGDFGHGFVDWNPAPPDHNMGLWRDVTVKFTGEAGLKNVYVNSDVNTETLDEATLTITADVVNHTGKALKGKLTGSGDGIKFSVPVQLEPGEVKKITVTPDDAASLRIHNPRLWWCHNMGEPNLYHIAVNFETGGSVSDSREIEFGIRKVEPYFNEQGHRGFKLNGKEILIRGAGWTDDIFLRDNEKTNEIQVQYVKHMNLNTIRFENIWGTSQNIYSLCDRYGILAMVGWSCQWEWENYLGKECDEFGGIKSQADQELVLKYTEDQVRYLQNHPSIFVWLFGSDMIPRPELEKKYAELLKNIDNRSYIASASWRTSEISGNTGVKMKGPYNYVGPSYWYIDSVNGGAYGFNTETGPGPQLPVLESIEKMIPRDKLWPINNIWNYHCNPSESFGDLSIFNNVLNNRYGQPSNLNDYLRKADVQAYEALGAMFEAFRANRPLSTGIIQWMLNSAWPSFYWQLYDYNLLPNAAYYAARKANAPVQVVFNYGNNQIFAVNETLQPVEKATIRIKLTDIKGKVIYADELIRDVPENKAISIHQLPEFQGIAFLSLAIETKERNLIADNFYWITAKGDEYDWDKTEWYYTPVKTSADFRALAYMPDAAIEVSTTTKEHLLEVKLENKSEQPGFFINAALKNEANQTLFPVFWNDNYISILPGESKTITCSVPENLDVSGQLNLVIKGWNMDEQTLNVSL